MKFLKLIICLLAVSFAFSLKDGYAEFKERNQVPQIGTQINFGLWQNQPVSWIVLDAEHTNTGENGMFLFSRYVLDHNEVRYDEEVAVWQDSDAQQWCKSFFLNNFSEPEQSIILPFSKTEKGRWMFDLMWRDQTVESENISMISAEEVFQYVGQYDGCQGISGHTPEGKSAYYWLRSAADYHPDYAGMGLQGNQIHDYQVNSRWGARPIVNIDLNKILLFIPEKTDKDENVFLPVIQNEEYVLQVKEVCLDTNQLTIHYETSNMENNSYLCLGEQAENGKIISWQKVEDLSDVCIITTDILNGIDLNHLVVFVIQDVGPGQIKLATAPVHVESLKGNVD